MVVAEKMTYLHYTYAAINNSKASESVRAPNKGDSFHKEFRLKNFIKPDIASQNDASKSVA